MPILFLLAAFGLVSYNAKTVPKKSTQEIVAQKRRELLPGDNNNK